MRGALRTVPQWQPRRKKRGRAEEEEREEQEKKRQAAQCPPPPSPARRDEAAAEEGADGRKEGRGSPPVWCGKSSPSDDLRAFS